MNAIHRVGDVTYFSGKGKLDKHQALRQHLSYILRNHTIAFGNFNQIVEDAKRYDTRWDARVALKFFAALPQDVSVKNIHTWEKDLRKVITETLNLDESKILIAFHKDGELKGGNPHVHIVATPVTPEGKKARITPQHLSNLHKKFDELLQTKGYTVRKNENEDKIEIPRWKLENPKIRKLYIQHRELIKQTQDTPPNFTNAIDYHINQTENDLLCALQDLRHELKALRKTDEIKSDENENIITGIETPVTSTVTINSKSENEENRPNIITKESTIKSEENTIIKESKDEKENTQQTLQQMQQPNQSQTRLTDAKPEQETTYQEATKPQTAYNPYEVHKLIQEMLREETKSKEEKVKKQAETCIFTRVSRAEDTPRLRR